MTPRSVLWTAAALGMGLVTARRLRTREADLHGEVALVTGGSRGLGLLLARELGRAGCRVAICARDEGELARARERLGREGVATLAIACDVADPEAVERLVGAITERWGPVGVLVNNASIIQVGPMPTMSRQDLADAMDVNFWGTVHPTLAVLPRMRERGRGRIVNVTSIGGKVAVPHLLPYTAAKHATVGFSEGLAVELAREGIRVTTVVPGLMRTGSYLNAVFDGDRRAEFTWFSLGATLPGVSMDAERAARQIVRAMRRGERERILSLPAALLARVHGVAPATTLAVLDTVNRLLPSADGRVLGAVRGHQVARDMRAPVLEAVTRLGRTAARRFHQIPPGEGGGARAREAS
jgi:NAD(P)-dependent dehydrogenase (short-subunit alcohol dehydrogenase family)